MMAVELLMVVAVGALVSSLFLAVVARLGPGAAGRGIASRLAGWRDGWSARHRRARVRRMAADMEEILPALRRRARAGKTPLDLVRLGAEEGRGSVLRAELQRVLGDYSVGVSLGSALEASYERTPDPTYGRFVAALELARETGGDLAHGLTALARVVREGRELRARVREETAEARYSAVIVAAIPLATAAYGLWGRSSVIQPLLTSPTGRLALLYAGVSWMLGVLAIRRVLSRSEAMAR